MSQSFYFPFFFFWVSTSYILFNQSHSLSQLIIFPSNKQLMFILLTTFPLNLNSLKFNNQSFSLSNLSSPYIKKWLLSPIKAFNCLPLDLKPTNFIFLYIGFELLSFHPISHQITTRIGRSIWGQFFFFFPWTFLLLFFGNFLWFVLDFLF